MLVSHLIHQDLYPGLLEAYNLGYYVELSSRTIAGKTWMSLTLETSHDPAYAERCIDLFLVAIQATLDSMPEDELSQRKAFILDSIKDPINHSFRGEAFRIVQMIKNHAFTGKPFVEGIWHTIRLYIHGVESFEQMQKDALRWRQ